MNIHSSLEPSQSLPRETPVGRMGPAVNSGAAVQPTDPRSISGEDTARLSAAALSAASSGASDVRIEKVAAIQQALASGSYAVSASDVAEKLIDHLLQR